MIQSNIRILNLVSILFFFLTITLNAQKAHPYPFSTDSMHLTVWNGTEYIPFFIKGVNLGVAIPGTFPGELAATHENYTTWFRQIKEAGFNCIRLYTLHYPRFYILLDEYNKANPQNPLLFFQGVWLEEELPGYDGDLYFMTDFFKGEMEENIDCVHGNRVIPHRHGKAFGTYQVDASQWCLGYIIGREVHPHEVLTTDQRNAEFNSYTGHHFSIINASPTEVWFTEKLDYVVQYEHLHYQTQRPVSNSSWPTLDPLNHPEEMDAAEDIASIDMSKIIKIDAPAGFFISYHAYPYYPDFISLQSSYQDYSDHWGPNSYLGYLNELSGHYEGIPLIIAEYGVPTSWMIAHYATSGMNHGGFDELHQGLANIRMLNNIRAALCGGGIQFAWIDEWFKRTWITDPLDFNIESRVLWHNMASAEQNFGLIAFDAPVQVETLVSFSEDDRITHLKASADVSFFELEIGLQDPLEIPDEMWVTFDTYSSDLGESILPNGDTIPFRSEFALHITNYSANLYVTQAYDVFGIWHNTSLPEQVYRSIPTDGAPWNIVRRRNNSFNSDIQYIGQLKVNLDFQPETSHDATTISDENIRVKLPWSYLNVVSPDQRKVLHYSENMSGEKDTLSDGFKVAVNYKNQWHTHETRYTWNIWNQLNNDAISERLKISYFVMQDHLSDFNTPAIAFKDSFYFEGPNFPVYISEEDGLLKNDFDLDGDLMICLLTETPKNGIILLDNNGSFVYEPFPGYVGYDSLFYCIYDGHSLSSPNKVLLFVDQSTSVKVTPLKSKSYFNLFPNPVQGNLNVEFLSDSFDFIQIFDMHGQLVTQYPKGLQHINLDVDLLNSGTYILVAGIDGKIYSEKFVKI